MQPQAAVSPKPMGVKETPQEANARGLACLRSGDHAAAIHAFTAATRADPRAGPLWRNLAHAHRLAGDAVGERAALEEALALDRTDFPAQLRLAQLLQRLGEEVAALQAWDGALQLAAHLPGHSPDLRRELDAGEAYCAQLRERMVGAAARALDSHRDAYTETEARRLDAFVGVATGQRRIYHNQCAGAHYPFLPEDEFFDRALFPSFAMLEAATADISAELTALLEREDELLRPYVRLGEGTPQNDWTPLDNSLDWGACFLWEYGEPNRAVLDQCPRTSAVLDQLPLARIPGRAPNAFFSLLRARSHIPPHTGVTNTRAIVHLALDVPPGCGFRVGNETREWVPGRAFAFDDTIEHEAWNDSDARRAVLILDFWNPHLTPAECAAITRYFAEADAALAR